MFNHIRKLREECGWSQTELGNRVGVGWQTVARVEQGRTALNQAKLALYASALGVEPNDLVGAKPEARMVTVAGFVQAGLWAETWELPEDDRYEVPVLAEKSLAPYTLHAAQVRGASMNRRFPEGSVVVFTDAIETREDIKPGRYYVVEREAADGLRETTVKRLHQAEDGSLWLVPESDDPLFAEAFPIDGMEGDTIRIVGRVRYAFAKY